MAITKLISAGSLIIIIGLLCAFIEAQKFQGPNRSHITLEGPHIRNLGYSGNIPEPKVSVRKTQQNQRKLTKGESCHENEQQCAKVFHSSFHPRISKASDDYGTRNEPVHPGPLKIEIRNLNLKPVKNATSSDFSPRYLHVDYGVSLVSNFLFKTIVTLCFVKTVEFVFNIVWNTAWKFAGWGVDHESTSVTLGGFGHPFAHYSTGWSDGSDTEQGHGYGNSYGHNPYAFSYHDHSLHRPTGNIYYPGNKYYSGSHTNIKALKKAAKKYGKKKHKKKYSKYFLPAIEYFDLDERKGKLGERKGEIDKRKGELDDGKAELVENKGKLDEVKLNENKGKVDENKAKLGENIAKLDENKGESNKAIGELDESKGKIDENKGELDKAIGGLDESKGKL